MNQKDWARARNRRWLAMWPNTVSDLAGISRNSELNGKAHSSGCQEHASDFGSLSIKNFSRYGNIPIVETLESDISLDVLSW